MYNTKEGKTCVIYIRVSSERQVKGYSLDGQKHYLAECAERRGMTVLDTYVEEGKSGKSIEGRTEFQRMLDDIQSGKVHTDYVLVFKLSRFGRNARDVLNSLEFIMKYGVHLMCVEDGLDSSTSMGKMMITILGAVAELERENIIAQSLLGREEKAKSGGWNGGFAPYGYRLVKGDDKSKGKLETVPEEKAVVQLVFDMFLNRNMGYTAISGYLNRNGYTRPPAKNAIRPSYGEWSSDHIKRMLSNPVYTGRVAWGKRRTEKVPGSDNEYRLVKQDEYILSEVISHEEFVSKEDFDRVQEIKAIRGKKGNHNIGQYNAHLLSGIVKCPQCGAPMYIGMTKWTNQDGTERRTESYVCSYATKHRGTSVCRRNGVVASQVEDEVMEYTRKIVRNPQFIKDLQEKVMTAVDMTEVENDITAYKNQLSALQRSRDSLERDIDRIAPDDKYAERRRADMTRRLNDLYDQIYKAEDLLQESTMKKATLESEQMSVQSMIGILSSFDAIYDRMNAAERRDLVKYLISEVELFPREEQKTQKRFVKAIAYKFPIEQKVLTQFDECGASVETVVLLEKEWRARGVLMESSCHIRKLRHEEVDKALSLVWKVFQEYEAPDYTEDGVEEFYKSIHDESYLSMLCLYGAFIREELVGIIATRSEGTHVALFFVDGKYHRQGIGKMLFQAARSANTTGKMTVNSSPYAVCVYHKLGFKDTDTEQVVNSLRFTPMVWNEKEVQT